tara:strand:- start:221 stop:910 length:690 start_codon:yes stop_codon:yes gene_type:complete
MTVKAYEGPSTVNGDNIMLGIGCEVKGSRNTKTGPMVQVGTMLRDVHPVEAVNNGADEAICGGCPLRPTIHAEMKAEGTEVSEFPCYVKKYYKVAQWKALKAASVDYDNALDVLAGRSVRFGEYGNLSSVPREVSEPLLKVTKNHTLYEHDWRNPENQWLALYAMASVHSIEEREEAHSMGWRTFRTGNSLESGEVFCPNYTHKIQCIDCNLCSGNSCGAKDIVNPPHK